MTRAAICALGGNRFERAGCHWHCCFALVQASEATTHHQLPIWSGPDGSCSAVLVLPTTRELGDELRILRFLGDLKAHFSDPQLHPLLERSFPGVVCCDPSEIPANAKLPYMATQKSLACWFGSDEQQLHGVFRPPTTPGTSRGSRCKIWNNQHESEHCGS